MLLHRRSVTSGSDALVGLLRPLCARAQTMGQPARVRCEPAIAVSDPAVRLITDFSWDPPVTITEDRPKGEAFPRMMRAGVGSLLVTRDDVTTGLLTSYDLQREGPWQLQIRHVMTPLDQVHRLDWAFVCSITAAVMVSFLRRTKATHVLIVEEAEEAGVFLRGILSRTRLERQLGRPLEY